MGHIYINIHQTLWAIIAVSALAAYVFNFKGVRTDLNNAIANR